MPNTAALNLRYPAASAPPDVPGDIYNLAQDIDGVLGAPWTSYNPSFTNVAGVTAAGEYVRVSRHVHFTGLATFGSSGTVGGQISMTLPLARRSYSQVSGRIFGVDTGTAIYELVPVLTSATAVALYYRPGGSASLAATANNAPFLWGNTDQLQWDLWYAVD